MVERHAEALECGGIYPRDTARGSALCAAPRRSPLLVRALSARHQKDKTQRIRLARLSPRLVVASSARKCCYPLRLLKLLLWLGRAKGVFSGARVLMIT